MTALVVYESVYGNTRAIARAIAVGMGDAEVVPVHQAADRVGGVDLLVVGGPTHMHGLSTARSRRMSAEAAAEDGSEEIEPGAAEEPGLRPWLRDLADGRGAPAAAFDTRLDRAPWLTGLASRAIAKRLRQHGYEVIDSESFLVQDSDGPLEKGELGRARDWGSKLAASLSPTATEAAP